MCETIRSRWPVVVEVLEDDAAGNAELPDALFRRNVVEASDVVIRPERVGRNQPGPRNFVRVLSEGHVA